VTAFGCLGENCREAAIQNSPGASALGEPGRTNALKAGRPRVFGRFVCCSTTVPNIGCHFSSFVPFSQNCGGQAGHLCQRPDPGLKPWAVLYRRFAAKSDEPLRDASIFLVARRVEQAHHRRMTQSIRNRIPGTIKEITSDPVLSEVVLDTTIGPVAAVITTRSLKELGLKVGDSAYGLVKATNVSIEKE
jgi:molybdopterin-binding protein